MPEANGDQQGEAAGQPDHEAQAERFLDLLRNAPNKRMTNKGAREALGVDSETYWTVRHMLLERGQVAKGFGRGGTTRLVPPDPIAVDADLGAEPEAVGPAAVGVDAGVGAEPEAEAPALGAEGDADLAAEPQAEVPAPAPQNERGWYAPLIAVLRQEWRQEGGYDECVVVETARQGARDTGGKWTRPDISAVTLTKHRFLPSPTFEIWTFEVKRAGDLDVRAVYEALAHARAATRAVVLACYDAAPEPDDEVLAVVAAEARRHGVGLSVVVWPATYELCWEDVVEPTVRAPGGEALNEFIAKQLRSEHDTIAAWFPQQ